MKAATATRAETVIETNSLHNPNKTAPDDRMAIGCLYKDKTEPIVVNNLFLMGVTLTAFCQRALLVVQARRLYLLLA